MENITRAMYYLLKHLTFHYLMVKSYTVKYVQQQRQSYKELLYNETLY